jgi:hypothetical protein
MDAAGSRDAEISGDHHDDDNNADNVENAVHENLLSGENRAAMFICL